MFTDAFMAAFRNPDSSSNASAGVSRAVSYTIYQKALDFLRKVILHEKKALDSMAFSTCTVARAKIIKKMRQNFKVLDQIMYLVK